MRSPADRPTAALRVDSRLDRPETPAKPGPLGPTQAPKHLRRAILPRMKKGGLLLGADAPKGTDEKQGNDDINRQRQHLKKQEIETSSHYLHHGMNERPPEPEPEGFLDLGRSLHVGKPASRGEAE